MYIEYKRYFNSNKMKPNWLLNSTDSQTQVTHYLKKNLADNSQLKLNSTDSLLKQKFILCINCSINNIFIQLIDLITHIVILFTAINSFVPFSTAKRHKILSSQVQHLFSIYYREYDSSLFKHNCWDVTKSALNISWWENFWWLIGAHGLYLVRLSKTLSNFHR